MAKYVSAQDLVNIGWNPDKVTNELIEDLNRTLVEFNITTSERIRHFLSQATKECDRGDGITEYASGRDYEFRSDLGNKYEGDGPKYKGAGAIHLTGRANYRKFADFTGDPRVMEGNYYVAANYPWRSAGFFWETNGLNELVDRGASVAQVTQIVNGGDNGLADRQLFYDRAVQFNVGQPIVEFKATLRPPGPDAFSPRLFTQ